MQDGKLAAERYAPGYGQDTRFVSWSMAKTVTAAMIGTAGRRWAAGTGRARPHTAMATTRRSAQRDHLAPSVADAQRLAAYRGGRPTLRIVGSAHAVPGRAGRYGDVMPRPSRWKRSRGRRFEYSSNTTIILADIAARVLTDNSEDPETRRRAVANYLRTRLFAPLGMTSIVPEFDASGTLIGGSLMHGTARDWARFGEFLRTKGSYRGAQILPRIWVEHNALFEPHCSAIRTANLAQPPDRRGGASTVPRSRATRPLRVDRPYGPICNRFTATARHDRPARPFGRCGTATHARSSWPIFWNFTRKGRTSPRPR